MGTFATSVTGETGDSLNLNLEDYGNIQELVDFIEATGNYTVTVLTDNPRGESPADLDAVSAQDIMTEYAATSDLQAIIDTLNELSGYVQVQKASGADAPPANQDWTSLSGGSDGEMTNDLWQEALDHLKTLDIDLIVPLTGDESVHAMVDSHASFMSGPSGKSERRVFVGGELQGWNGESARSASIDALKTAAKNLNSDRTVHVGLGSRHYDAQGESRLFPAYITACMYAGISAGGGPVLPLTRKYLRTQGLEVELRRGEVDQLIEAGIAAPIPDWVQGAGFVVSRQVTTWGQDDNDYRVEFSVGYGADYVAREVRNRHELLVGEPGTPGLDQTVLNITNAVLQEAKNAEIIRDYDPKATQLRVDGTIRYIDYMAQPILPINWIFSTYHLEPTRVTIQL